MASQLILDRSDPGVDELVSSWEDGGEYTVTLTIRQTSSSENTGNYEVTSVEAEEMPEEAPAPAEEPPIKATPPAGKKAMTVPYKE